MSLVSSMLLLGTAATVFAEGSAVESKVATLKQSLAESSEALRQYEWIETTVVHLKGEEKSRQQKRCYYGADGKVQKLAIGAPASAAEKPSGPPGKRRRARRKAKAAEKKKAEMSDYMKRAVNTLHLYVPPDPALLERAKKSGKVAVRPVESDRLVIEFEDYLESGDQMSVTLGNKGDQLLGASVQTYLGTPEEPLKLTVEFGALVDGTSYVQTIDLEASTKKLRVTIENSGYRRVGGEP